MTPHQPLGSAEFPALASRLREKIAVSDSEFDALLPRASRLVSSAFWTPVSVAVRAAALLVQGPHTRVLDMGSGVGKFCIVGAATTGASFVGVEHREHFVQLAKRAAQRIEVGSAHFIHGTIDAATASEFDAFYLFNPFEENRRHPRDRLDDTVQMSQERFCADVKCVQEILGAARVGTRVVTYHGFGGEMPAGYWLALRESHRSGWLNLWVKVDSVTVAPLHRRPAQLPRFLAG